MKQNASQTTSEVCQRCQRELARARVLDKFYCIRCWRLERQEGRGKPVSFEVFRKQHTGPGLPDDMTVRCSSGRITFTRRVSELLSATRVLLLWDKEAGRVALKRTDDLHDSFCVGRQSPRSQYVQVKNFLMETGLTRAGVLPVVWNEDEQRLEFDIPEKTVRSAMAKKLMRADGERNKQ